MLAMRGGSQVGNNGVKMTRPPPVPPRPDKSVVADALAKSRRVPAPVLPAGLKKKLASKSDTATTQQETPQKSMTNKSPSPKLHGLSRVKSFIRDVINDKKNSAEEKKATKEKDAEYLNGKNGVKSHIPIPQAAQSPKGKNQGPASLNYSSEESVKNQSSQSVVRSLCSVLMNSDKDKTPVIESTCKVTERVRVIKSNSFAEKAIPTRRAPPPPISPKPTKKQIEERLSRSQETTEGFSMRKLSASCEELNNSNRPIIYQSPKKLSSPMPTKKGMAPGLPLGKPPFLFRKKSDSSSPIEDLSPTKSLPNNKSPFLHRKVDNADKTPLIEDNVFSFGEADNESDTKCATEKLISEIVAAKNEELVSQFINKQKLKTEDGTMKANKCFEKYADTTNENNTTANDTNVVLRNGSTACIKNNRINYVNVSCGATPTKIHKDSVSSCSSDSSSGGGKTILFINSETVAKPKNRFASDKSPVSTINIKPENNTKDSSPKRFDDIANHELLIAELQGMRRDAVDERVNKRQRQPSLDLTPSSPDSISAETQNIQHSDWMQVEDNGKQVRYSSCQILIEDPLPVDDSGICLDENCYADENVPYSLSPSLVSRLKEQFYANQKMSSLQGLPPLPKSLSGFNVNEGGRDGPPPVPARTANSFRYNPCAPPSPPSPESSAPSTPASRALNGTSSSSSETHRPRKLTTLDTQLAVLKREMVSLRQLDLSLLSQLWSLNESIHEFRQCLGSGGGAGGGGGNGGDEDGEDEAEDSSSGGEESAPPRARPAPPPPRRGRTPV